LSLLTTPRPAVTAAGTASAAAVSSAPCRIGRRCHAWAAAPCRASAGPGCRAQAGSEASGAAADSPHGWADRPVRGPANSGAAKQLLRRCAPPGAGSIDAGPAWRRHGAIGWPTCAGRQWRLA
jgi:hypothetical protein